jgi:hypothetical protein
MLRSAAIPGSDSPLLTRSSASIPEKEFNDNGASFEFKTRDIPDEYPEATSAA